MTPIFLKSAAQPSDFLPDDGREVAVVGRSNSGKSSALNTILAHGKLARVSKTPGRTQLINFFGLTADTRLVDLPGYGFARVGPEVRARWEALMTGYFESRTSLVGLMITVDIRRGLLELDQTMLRWCHALEVPVYILATKADKLSRTAGLRQIQAIQRDSKGLIVGVCRFSSLDRTGVKEARQQLEAWLESSSGPT